MVEKVLPKRTTSIEVKSWGPVSTDSILYNYLDEEYFYTSRSKNILKPRTND